MNKCLRRSISLISILAILLTCTAFTGCDFFGADDDSKPAASQQKQTDSHSQDSSQTDEDSKDELQADGHEVDLSKIPDWDGEPSIEINDNEPAFTESELQKINDLSEDDLSSLDDLGRCGDVTACVTEDTMPEGSRGSIGMVKPAGWHLVKYDFIDGKYLYNRCHLIGWQLTGEGAEERNLITGTRYLNVDGMLPYENQVADYVRETGNPVAYRVEPVYNGDELLARGVHIEAKSLENFNDNNDSSNSEGNDDSSDSIDSELSFNVYCYNVQPNVAIDYETGKSTADENATTSAEESSAANGSNNHSNFGDNSGSNDNNISSDNSDNSKNTYILNTNTKRYHLDGCRSLSQMKNKNKKTFHGSKQKLKEMGYAPCGNCNP